MEKVLVLLSTYNGEKFIDVQLNSILNQEGVQVHILIRDDGSKDSTLKILRKYAEVYENITVLEEANCGAIFSFYKLMNYALNDYPDYKYFAFSDQDDYWYPTKLQKAINGNINNNDNYLYHSCYHITDENLNILSHSPDSNIMGTLGEALITNPSIGCTEVFTFSVLQNSAKICNYKLDNKNYYPYHDLWVYLVALATKADICFDQICGIKYRQHASNVIGTGKSKFQTLKLQCMNLFKKKNLKSGFAKILLALLNVDNDMRDTLELVCNYNKSLSDKIALLRDEKFHIKDNVRKWAFICSVICGVY